MNIPNLFHYEFTKHRRFSRETLKNGHASVLRFSSALVDNDGTITYPLYPYDSKKLAVIFVYGTNYQRKTNIVLIPKSTKILAILIVTFIILSAIVLYFARQKWHLRRRSPSSALLDTMIAFIAGGNLEMRHRFERWFFGILLFGAFFITSIYTGDLLDCIFSILNQKVETFEQLAKTNSTIFVNPSLGQNAELIWNMLGWDSWHDNDFNCS